jgi:hypothetical protein
LDTRLRKCNKPARATRFSLPYSKNNEAQGMRYERPRKALLDSLGMCSSFVVMFLFLPQLPFFV